MTSADSHVVALDLGTSGVKVAVTTVRGELVASAVERYPLHVLGDGGVEQDPADWWDAVVRGTRRALGQAGADRPGWSGSGAAPSGWGRCRWTTGGGR